MQPENNKSRILFIDLIRAFAVLMMVQGHTVDTLLADRFRDTVYPAYSIWHFMRGLTAPIFMFSAGTVFTYLLKSNNLPFKENPRVIKGIKRFLLLVGIGYLLRYPTPFLVYFKDISESQWRIFFAVDALHLIGFGILITIFTLYLSDKFKVREKILLPTGAFLFFALFPLVNAVNWIEHLPAPLAAYLYNGNGSLFPIFPWVGFVLAGAALGNYLVENPGVFKSISFSGKLLGLGIIFVLVSFLGNAVQKNFNPESNFADYGPNLMIFRLGLVLVMNSIFAYFAMNLRSVPNILLNIGKNTLPIYVVHLVILYGSAWNLGFAFFYHKSLGVWTTIFAAAMMLTLMISMVQSFQFVKVFWKKKVVAVNN